MSRQGYCPICKQHGLYLTRHHIWKTHVWGQDQKKQKKKIWICRLCHDQIEQEITRRENEVLKNHPEIYIGTLQEFLNKNRGY